MTQAQAVRPSQPVFRDRHSPVEVLRDGKSANLVIKATNQNWFSTVFSLSSKLTISDLGKTGFSATVKGIRVGADYEFLRWATQISDTELELRSYAQLEDNWDGEGAVAPSQAAIDDALTFLGQRPPDIPLPYPEEGKEGDVGVYWDNPKAKVFTEVSFKGDGTFSYFAVHGVPSEVIEKCGQDGLEATTPWPEDLLQILRKMDSA